MIKQDKSYDKKNILFIATTQNYYVDNQASFQRMYMNLLYFHNHSRFNVFVLQPKNDKHKENLNLKKDIKTFYFKHIKILWYTLVPFTDFNPFYITKVKEIVKRKKIDLIHIDYPYGINSLRIFKNIPLSYNSYNVEYIYTNTVGKFNFKIPKFMRFLFSLYIFFLEKSLLKYVTNINAISKNDKNMLLKLYNVPEEKINISTFGCNEKIYNFPLSKSEARFRQGIEEDSFYVIFHGDLLNKANFEAIQVIRNKIAKKLNNEKIVFLIAGRNSQFKNEKNIIFLGYLNDLRNFLYSADIAIVPIFRGSGIKTKIIDYLSASIPIITTKKGAEGLFIKHDIHGYILDQPKYDFVEKILYLKNNPEKIKEFKYNIKEVIKNYNWNRILKPVAEKYMKILKMK